MSEEPRSPNPSPETEPAPPRPSRQALVQPPPSTSPTLILGALACAAAGFAVVWVLGIGGRPRVVPSPDGSVAVVEAPLTDVPEQHVAVSEPAAPATTPPDPPRFFVPPENLNASAEPPAGAEVHGKESRFSAQPVALETAPEDAAAEPPPKEPAAPSTSGERASQFSTFTDDPPPEPLATAPHEEPAEATAPEEPQSEPKPVSPPEPAAPPAVVPPVNAAELRSPPLEATLAASVAARQTPAAPTTKRPPSPEAFDDPEAPVPVTPPGGGTLAPQRPPHERVASSDTSRGFGAVPPAAADSWGVSSVPSSTPAAAPLAAPMAGSPSGAAVGRPGPIQLEGVQTPQVAIEKRGPREVQVGKSARYDMIVRNVGSAAAHDVILRDRVPQGTRLLSTSPPAAPAEDGQLVWSLGSLPQGGQVRVAMEVMPTEEGEVGSVASVSFRADASVRSVATRAALAIDVAQPKAVLVGNNIELAITISNPGTGEATGVVLEGVLPQGFRHAAGSELEFDVGRLRPGETRRVDLELGSTHPGVSSLRLVARADGEIEAERVIRLEVTAPTLELTAKMPARRYLQRPATCVIDVANTGTAPANAVELAVQLPAGMKFVRANNAGYYEEATHRVLWHLEQLPHAEVGTVEMVLMPTELGTQRIAAAARSADGLSAQVSHTVEVEGLAAILFEVGDSEDPIEVDGITEYVIRVGNQGTKPATGVRVAASLLGDLEPLDAKGPVGYRVENLTFVFEPLAKLSPAEESMFRIRVRGRRAGDQRVQVQVTSDDNPTPITKEEVTRVYEDR